MKQDFQNVFYSGTRLANNDEHKAVQKERRYSLNLSEEDYPIK